MCRLVKYMLGRKLYRPETIVALCAAGLVWLGCNGTPSGGADAGVYRLEGAIIKNLDIDSCWAVITLDRHDSALTTAELALSGETLLWISGAFRCACGAADSCPSGAHVLSVQDNNDFADTLYTVLPGPFTAGTTGLPDNRINPGGNEVTIDWTPSAGAEGYIIGVVLRDSLYQGYGYSQWASTGATSATIPPDAFHPSNRIEPDSGWYYAYIYAYADSPDSSLAAAHMPSPTPGNLADNVADKNFSGRFGAVVVSRRDSVHVVSQ